MDDESVIYVWSLQCIDSLKCTDNSFVTAGPGYFAERQTAAERRMTLKISPD